MQIAELQNHLDQQALKERQKELEEAQQKMAEKLERETREQTKDPEKALFSLQAKNLLKATQQYGELKTLREVQSRLPTQPEREAFAPKIVAKAYQVQKDLIKAAEKQNKLAHELQSRKPEENETEGSGVGATKGGDPTEGEAAGEFTVSSPDAPTSRQSGQADKSENRLPLPNRTSSIDAKV